MRAKAVFLSLLLAASALALPPATAPVGSAAIEASNVLLPAKGLLYSLAVYDSATEYIMIINSATVPANGAVDLLVPPIKVAADTTTLITFPQPLYGTKGIVVCNSSTGTFTKTIGGSTCIFKAQVQSQ
jgi:hypothetical protein